MENVYKLEQRFRDIQSQYEDLQFTLEEIYENNGGEVTEDTEQREAVLAEMEALKQSILDEIVENADAYAEIALNKAAERKILEAELKALKEEQLKAQEVYKRKIARYEQSEQWWKENFLEAMRVADITKIGGPKTKNLHSIYIAKTESIAIEPATFFRQYEEKFNEFRATLPPYISLSMDVQKTMLKKEENLPEGASIVTNEQVRIR